MFFSSDLTSAYQAVIVSRQFFNYFQNQVVYVLNGANAVFIALDSVIFTHQSNNAYEPATIYRDVQG